MANKLSKTAAGRLIGGLSRTSKMPCRSYSLPTAACVTGAKMAKVAGSICSGCYANKGNYVKYAASIQPAQYRRLDSLQRVDWVALMVAAIGTDQYFRWHDSGDLQNVEHLEKIAAVARATPHCRHWLPTREYGMVAAFIANGGEIPDNLVVRLSAMFVDQPVKVPASLQGAAGIAVSHVHSKSEPHGNACHAPAQNGECRDCRACWQRHGSISYHQH